MSRIPHSNEEYLTSNLSSTLSSCKVRRQLRTVIPILFILSVGFYLVFSGLEDLKELVLGLINVLAGLLLIIFYHIADDKNSAKATFQEDIFQEESGSLTPPFKKTQIFQLKQPDLPETLHGIYPKNSSSNVDLKSSPDEVNSQNHFDLALRLKTMESPRSLMSTSSVSHPFSGPRTPFSATRLSTRMSSILLLDSFKLDKDSMIETPFSMPASYNTSRSSMNCLSMEMDSSEMVKSIDHVTSSQRGYLRRSNRTMSLINPAAIDRIQRELSRQNLVEGQALRDVKEIQVSRIKHREMIDFWREFRSIRFYKSRTVTKVVHNILNTTLPDIGETYANIIHEFLHADWPIGIFLHGGLLRDILTSTIGNDVDITFTCSHLEMKEICDKKGWKSRIRDNMPYWVLGGEVDFETKLEGFPLSFNGLAKYQVSDFAANTIYYDCKNDIIIDRYGKGVEAALAHRITLSVHNPEEWEEWRDADYFVGAKLFRFYKFIIRGFDYDVDEARFVQESIQKFVTDSLESAVQSCWRAVKPLAREQPSREKAIEYKAKLRKSVVEVYKKTMDAEQEEAEDFWVQHWEPLMYGVMCMGNYDEDKSSEEEDDSKLPDVHIGRTAE